MTFPRVIEVDRPDSHSLEGRSSLVFKVLAIVNVAGMILAIFPAIALASTLHTIAFNAAAGALAAVYLVTARALDRRIRWATAAARPLLLLLMVLGATWAIEGFAAGRIRIPFELALAIWAFLGPSSSVARPGQDRKSLAAVAGTAALMASMVFGRQVYGWGGLLDVQPGDLQASMTVNCGAPGDGPPETLEIGYDFAWRRTSPLPNGLDVIVIGWTGGDAEGRPLYLIGTLQGSTGGIREGYQAAPSSDMARAIGAESSGSWHWGVELDKRGYAPGRINLELRKIREGPPGAMTLTISASYVHLGIWRSDVTKVTCAW